MQHIRTTLPQPNNIITTIDKMTSFNQMILPYNEDQRLDVNSIACVAETSIPFVIRPVILARELNRDTYDLMSQYIADQRMHLYFRFVVSKAIHDIVVRLKPQLHGQSEYANIIETFDQHLKVFLSLCSTTTEPALQQSSYDSDEQFSYWSVVTAQSTLTFDCHIPSYYCYNINTMRVVAKKFREYLNAVDIRWSETPRGYPFTFHEANMMDMTVYRTGATLGLPNSKIAKRSGLYVRQAISAIEAGMELPETMSAESKYFPHFVNTLYKARQIVGTDSFILSKATLAKGAVTSVHGAILPITSSDLEVLKSYDIKVSVKQVVDVLTELNVTSQFAPNASIKRSINHVLWNEFDRIRPVDQQGQSYRPLPPIFGSQVDSGSNDELNPVELSNNVPSVRLNRRIPPRIRLNRRLRPLGVFDNILNPNSRRRILPPGPAFRIASPQQVSIIQSDSDEKGSEEVVEIPPPPPTTRQSDARTTPLKRRGRIEPNSLNVRRRTTQQYDDGIDEFVAPILTQNTNNSNSSQSTVALQSPNLPFNQTSNMIASPQTQPNTPPQQQEQYQTYETIQAGQDPYQDLYDELEPFPSNQEAKN